jgi:HAE1 family hydrophobic/amphiphilic exporter-1
MESAAARGRMVENVSSISRVGKALITVEYGWNTDMDEAFLDLQKAMADFSQSSEVDEITVSQHDPNAMPVVVAIFSHPEISDLDMLRQTAENNIRNELIRLPGVAAVELVGERRREVEIRTDINTLEAYGLTLDQLSSSIISSNRNMSGGSIVEMGVRYVIRGIGELTSENDINNIIVAYKTLASEEGGTTERIPIFLREVADVNTVLSEPDNIVRHNSKPCLALEIFKEARSNTIEASKSIHAELENLRRSLPAYNLQVIQDQAGFIKSAITETGQTGIIGIILAILVLYVFLRRIGVTAVISMAIPISVVATFNLMYFNNLTLNIMTLGGLALGAGMLVDNSIVVMENIFRHLEEGKSPAEASALGAGEVGGAITSSTLTTIAVFLPIVYLHGVAGELFREQAWTVAFSLFSSLFVALAVIPMLCSRFLKRKSSYKPVRSISFPRYRKFLAVVLKRKMVVVFAAAGLVTVTALLIPYVGSEFIPHAEQGELFINLLLPEGTSLERTEGAVKNLEAVIQQQYGPHISHIYSRIGPGGTSSDEFEALTDENKAVIQLILNAETSISTAELIAWLNSELLNLPDIKAQLIQQQTALQTTLGTTAAPLVVEIKGKDLEVLAQLAENVKNRITQIPELTNIETSFQEGRPEININIDRTVASQFSLSAENIGSQLKDLLSGSDLGQIEDKGEYINMMLRTPDISLSELEGILLESPSGSRVRLDEVARLSRETSPREIIRNNQVRIAEIRAHLAGNMPFDKTAKMVTQAISEIPMPAEYSFDVTGEEKLREESFGNLKFALLLAIILVYMVMAAQFESLLHPLVILLTIPLAGVGAVLLLLILGMHFNIMSFIGIIILAGIAVNDSIILVDRINQNRRAGLDIDTAVVNAGQTRIRPIIMTSVTTILALLPLTFGIGEGAALRAPMAIAVIGGLFSSTALTLVVIPSVYHLMAGKVKRVKNDTSERSS